MDEFVTDTHALIWYLTDSQRLGAAAAEAFREADSGGAIIHIPAIVLAELYYVNSKLGSPIDFADTFKQLDSAPQFVLTPFDPEDTLDFDLDSSVSEMHDRMIVGLARRLTCPLLTIDRNIIDSERVETVW